MATTDDYNEIHYFEAFKPQFERVYPNIKWDTMEGLNLYLQYLNYIQNRRIAMELAQIHKTLKLEKSSDENEKQV